MLMRSSSVMALVAVCGVAASASAVVRDAVRVLGVGDVIPGTPGLVCSTINDPYTDGNGEVCFSGNSDGGNFIFHINQAIWLNTDALPGNTLTGAEGTMGCGNAGQFIYSPSIDGNDGVWTHAGRLLAKTDAAPNFPGKFNSFDSRPGMAPSGAAFWVAGNADTASGSTNQRVFYKVADPASPVFENILVGGNTYAGLTLTATGIEFGYDVDDSTQNYVFTCTNTTVSSTDRHILKVDPAGYTIVAQEGTPVPTGLPGEIYTATFRIPSINVHGDVVLAGDTSAPTATDEIVMFNGAVKVREGDTVDGVPLAGTATMVSVDNCGNVAYIFGTSTTEALYYGQGADLKNTSKLILATGDQVDFDGDGFCDGVVADFNASATIAPGLDLAEDGMIYVSVDIAPCAGGTGVETIIGVRASCRADWDKSGFVDIEDFTNFVLEFEAGDADADCSGFTDTDDYDWFVKQFEKGC